MTAVLLSVASNIGNLLLDKYLLARQRMSLRQYIPLLFGFLFLVTAITLPWTGRVNSILVANQQYIFYLVLMVLLAIIWNMFYYEGLQKEKMVEFQMILMLTPIVTVLLSALFFPEEFKLPVFGAALVGSLALFLSHVRGHHLQFSKYDAHLVLAVLLIAMETMVQKELLAIYSPALLYAIRTGFIALFFMIYYRPNIHEVTNPQFQAVFVTAALGALAMVTKFIGFQELGVTMTTLLLLVVPIIASWADARQSGKPVSHRTLIAFAVIVGCVIYALMNA